MKMTFLGTSAGESYPGIWCECPNCAYARLHGGRNIRMNSCALIDNDTLIDFNDVGFHTAARMGISLNGVRRLFITHPDGDHISHRPLHWRLGDPNWENTTPEEAIAVSLPRFSQLTDMTVYGNEKVKASLEALDADLFTDPSKMHMTFTVIEEGKKYTDGDVTFVPVVSHHGRVAGYCHNYIISRGGKTLLYASDTGGYDQEMYDLMAQFKYDAIIMECTFGLGTNDYTGHMNLERVRALRSFFLEKGCITPDTTFCLTHMSPHWAPPYDRFAPMMEKEGITVAYDGMVLDI